LPTRAIEGGGYLFYYPTTRIYIQPFARNRLKAIGKMVILYPSISITMEVHGTFITLNIIFIRGHKSEELNWQDVPLFNFLTG
jgi:hypothetical protein